MQSGYEQSEASEPPTPDIYNQILEVVDDTKQIAQSVRDDADKGLFNGKDGDDGKSAYEIAVSLGFVGTEQQWIDSLRYDHSDEFAQLTEQVRQALETEGNRQNNAIVEMGTEQKEAITNEGTLQKKSVTDAGEEQVEFITEEGNKQKKAVTDEGTKQLEAVNKAVEGIVADREQITQNKEDITTLKEEVTALDNTKADGIIETASGEIIKTEISSDSKLTGLKVFGKSEQVATTGKNLFSSNYDEYTLPLNYYIYPLILNKGETYTVSIKSVSKIQNIVINILRSGSAYPFENTEVVFALLNLNDSMGDRKGIFTVDETFTAPAIAIYAESKESFNSIFEAKEIQLEKGSIATSYEPYTGGKPSPSPDYPQEIKNVGKWNEEKQKYAVDVKVTGKNLIHFPYLDGNKVTRSGITYTVLQDGSVHCVGKATDNSYFRLASKNFGNSIEEVNENFKLKDCYYNANNKLTSINFYPEEGEINTVKFPIILMSNIENQDYEPYKPPQTITLALDRPLTKWDRLEKREGVWGIARQGKTKVLKAAPEEEWAVWADKQNAFFIRNDKIIKEGLCSHFKAKSSFEIGKETGIYLSDTIHLIVTDMNINSLENWKTWLQANPITVTYKTYESNFVPLPQSEQDAIRALKTYYPTTVISNDENAGMEVSYVADTKNYINQKIDTINAVLVNIQKALL